MGGLHLLDGIKPIDSIFKMQNFLNKTLPCKHAFPADTLTDRSKIMPQTELQQIM